MHPLRYARAESIYEDGSNRVYDLINKNEGICELRDRSLLVGYAACSGFEGARSRDRDLPFFVGTADDAALVSPSAAFVERVLTLRLGAGSASNSAAICLGDSAITCAGAISIDGLRPSPRAFATLERRSE